MRLNIFKIPNDQVASLTTRLDGVGLSATKAVKQAGWDATFYFSKAPAPSNIPWAKTFAAYLPDDAKPKNRSHFAVFLFTKGDDCFALSFGKSHFYIRPYCDYDFGIELAKRVANEGDIRQTAGKRFAGKRTKDIKSYAPNTPLLVESGESVDYLQASVVPAQQKVYGRTGKFGTSAQLAPKIDPPEIGKFLNGTLAALKEGASFKLPRTINISDKDEVAHFDELLTEELKSEIGTSDFTNNAIDLYGVDFVFPSQSAGRFILHSGHKKRELDQLTMGDLKQFIADKQIASEDILKIRITHEPEDGAAYSEGVKQSVDFIPDGERVVLSGGKWLHFNQDYLDFLDGAIRDIEVEEVEDQFQLIIGGEPEFNASAEIAAAGFVVADKNFDIFKTKSSTSVEAWDLQRDETVYAVKFGTAQKLHYVCDQALNTLELLRGRAEVKQVDHFDRYCLWFGYRAKKLPESLAASGSIILKQKVEAWARKARELGVTPVIRLSRNEKNSAGESVDGPEEL